MHIVYMSCFGLLYGSADTFDFDRFWPLSRSVAASSKYAPQTLESDVLYAELRFRLGK